MDKTFVCSDVHDDYDALKTFADYAQSQDASNILIAGDLSLRPYTKGGIEELINNNDVKTFIKSKREHNEGVLKGMKEILDGSGIPYQLIPGNYDSNESFEKVFGDKSLHLKTSKLGDLKIGGYGGADAYPEHMMRLAEIGEVVDFKHEELYEFLKREKPDVGLIHNPPQGMCDDMFNGENVGTPATTKYIAEEGPKLILSGHIHEAGPNGGNQKDVYGISGYENDETGKLTVVLNPGNLGRFELLDPRSLEHSMQFDYGTFSSFEMDEEKVKRVIQYSVKAPERSVGDVKIIIELNL
ncbi:metallophosphoesterase [Nanoarchaeota archaeon]